MINLSTYVSRAQDVAEVIEALMLDELNLQAPSEFTLKARDDRVYLIASYDPMQLGRSLRVYEHPDIARRLRMALSMPVTITKETGTRYVVLMSGALKLPKSVNFPDGYLRADVFRLGVGLRGEVIMPARYLRNVMIGAG